MLQKKICLSSSIAFRRHFCCQKIANYQAICHRFYYTVQIPLFPATFVERLTALLSPRYLRLLRQRYTKYKAQQNGWNYHSVVVSYTVASREFVRQIPNTTAQSCCKSLGMLTPEERRNKMTDKNARIELRVTQSEKNKIAKLSESCGLSQSEYVRQRTLGYAPRTVLPDVFFDFYQMPCRLCDEVADKVSPETERNATTILKKTG